MHRRRFIAVTPVLAASGALALAACTTTPPSSDASPEANAGKRRTIDADADATMTRLYETVKGSRELVGQAVGMLVFPHVISAGFWIGGQYGQGVLRVGTQTSGYYSITAASFGLQIGAQSKAVILLFMTKDALDGFVRSQGWAAGVDATVALVKIGANGNIDTSTAMNPVEAIVMTNAGLMAGVSLEGSKISRLII
jgi:lipid-binding SYLF domain-containing protein